MSDLEENEFFFVTIALSAVIGLFVIIKCAICCVTASAKEHSHVRLQGKGIRRAERRNHQSKVMNAQPYFLNKDDLYIFWRCWEPKGDIRAVLVLCHGLNSHSGRYHHFGKLLNEQGVKVYALDHQGHGQSEGDRIYVKTVDDFADDVVVLLNKARNENPDIPLFLFGHSMGGLIATVTTLKAQDMLNGTILSAPALTIDPAQATPTTIWVLSKIASVFPKGRLKGLDLSTVVSDQLVRDHFANDPLRANMVPTLGLQVALLKGMENVNERAAEFNKPFWILHGTGDKVVTLPGSESFIEKCGSEDKNLIVYDGAYHELVNEPEDIIKKDDKETPLEVVLKFIEDRI